MDHTDAPVRKTPSKPQSLPEWLDRDLSWLEFNRRVLAEALDDRTPLLERVKFLAIFTSNLDEFFMKRMAVLRDRGTPARLKLLAEIRERLLTMLDAASTLLDERLIPELGDHGIHLCSWSELSSTQRQEAAEFFDRQISPALTPLIIHPTQPFPFFSNLSLSLAFVLHDDRSGETVNARVKVPPEVKQWVPLTAGVAAGRYVFVPLHEVIRENAGKLYPGMRLSAPTQFRLTRDAEVEIEDDGDQGLRELVREQIRQRRYEPAVRLEFGVGADPGLQHMLQERFGLTSHDVYDLPGGFDCTSLFQIASLPVPTLRDPDWTPVVPKVLGSDETIFDVIERGDVILHHPYESFDDSVERFISDAADDPQTLAIKMTVYRVGDDTPFVRSLVRAAESGKQVACVIELKARFDEERNLHWATELERAGAHVTVGNTQLKTHAKVALVVRRTESGLRTYAHVGTGNYHVKTARLYTDIGLLTCDPAITADIVNLFHHLTGRSAQPPFQRLLVAPSSMRRGLIDLIAREATNHQAGKSARIVAQMNQLDDPEMLEALCHASRAGVPIDLVVRGFCTLRPGLPGHTETIRVRSVIGRFLEHARIFHFAAGEADPLNGDFYIGSADWMHRNLSCRVETVTPIASRRGRQRLWEILETLLQDERQTWLLDADGRYTQLRPETGADARKRAGTHEVLMSLAMARDIDALPGYSPAGAPDSPAAPPRRTPTRRRPRKRVPRR